MNSNRGIAYVGQGKVEVEVEVRPIDFPKLEDPRGRRIDHGVILRAWFGAALHTGRRGVCQATMEPPFSLQPFHD
jgi:hypothetical protein